MEAQEYYQEKYGVLKETESELRRIAWSYKNLQVEDEFDSIIYITSRIKTPASLIEKLKKKNLSTDCSTALQTIHDVVGLRIICSFVEDVYAIADWLKSQDLLTVIQIKDYIANPKPNGYRSLHLIVRMSNGIIAEIQLRTIALDFWASLEHQIKYKKQIMYETTVSQELKSCADEIASLDLSMQTLRDILKN